MAVRLVNKSSADCDINLFSGGTARIKPFSSITIKNEDYTVPVRNYYGQLGSLGLFVEPCEKTKKAAEVKEPEVETSKPEEAAEVKEPEVETSMSAEELMKLKKSELVQIASDLGISEAEGLSKSQIVDKIKEAENV